MKPFWHPLSTVLIAEPRCYATPTLLRMLLAAGNPQLVYAGDRMWPALKHGDSFEVSAWDRSQGLAVGTVVLCCPGGIPDLLRAIEIAGDEVRLAADADASPPQAVRRAEVLAIAGFPPAMPSQAVRVFRRLRLDLAEAATGGADPADDPAETVRAKYDHQAPLYARASQVDIDPALLEAVRARVRPSGRVLIVGSGSGRECCALALAGFSTSGVDFSPAMVARAAQEAARRGLAVDFKADDIRAHARPEGELDGVLFTYDVYSFIPSKGARLAVLRRIRAWLAPGGTVFLSARPIRSAYERAILTLQWAARRNRDRVEWGATHTRWVALDGSLRRSFVRMFLERQLRAEIEAAGFRMGPGPGGHVVLTT